MMGKKDIGMISTRVGVVAVTLRVRGCRSRCTLLEMESYPGWVFAMFEDERADLVGIDYRLANEGAVYLQCSFTRTSQPAVLGVSRSLPSERYSSRSYDCGWQLAPVDA
jgi:hypothetical protein